MGLGEIFDGIVREIGKSDVGGVLRDSDRNIDHFFRSADRREKARWIEQRRQYNESNSSSNNSDVGLGSMLFGVAVLGVLSFLCKDDNKNETTK